MSELSNVNAEKYLIKCMYTRPNTIVEIAQNLKVRDFYNPCTRYLFKAIKEVSLDGDITPEAIMTYLETRNESAYKEMIRWGGAKFIEVTFRDETLPPSPSVKEQIEVVRSLTYRRNAVNVSEKIKILAESNCDPDTNITFEQIDELDDKIKELTYSLADNLVMKEQIKTIGNAVDALRAEIKSGATKGIDIGGKFPKFNKMIKRLRDGALIVIGAPEKVGKSSMMLDIAWFVAYDLKLPVAYADSEMTTEEQLLRICSKISGVPEDLIANNLLDDHQQKVVDAFWEEIKEVPFYHFNVNEMTNNEVESKVKLLQLQHGIRLLVYDYVKIQSHEVGLARPDLVLGGKLDTLKERIAKHCNIPVITSGQMYPKSDQRSENNKFAESSHFTKLADVICRLDKCDPLDPMSEGTHYIELITGRKVRSSDIGKKIFFDFNMEVHHIKEL